jgi:hypothetical protein
MRRSAMERRSRRKWLPILAATVVVVLVMAAIWAAAPEDVRGLLMVVGGVFYGVAVVGGYVVERRLHW